MKRKILFICVGAALLIALTAGLLWWYLPTTFLRGTDPADVDCIKVFNGTTGRSFTIEDPADIEYIVSGISDVKMRKVEYRHVNGFVYSLSFCAADGTRIDGFVLNSSDTIRVGAVEYKQAYETCEDALCFAYIKALEEAQQNQPNK